MRICKYGNECKQKGRLYQRGKSLQNDLRSLLIDEIVNEGGDIVNGYFLGNFATIASKFRVKYDTVVKIWRQFVANNDHERPKPRSAGVTCNTSNPRPRFYRTIENR